MTLNQQNTDKLEILVISDIHESKENIEKLIIFCKKNYISTNYIFCLGDIVTIPQGKQEDKSICEQKEKEIKEMFILLEQINSNIIYLPGNHDPVTLFKDPPKITENSINLHLSSYKIKDDLLLIGLGGSNCSIKTDETLYHSYENLDTKNIIWKGYPYIDDMTSPNYEKSDELLKNDLDKLENYINDFEGKIVLLTHMGPFISNTSNPFDKESIIYAGSQAVNDLILKFENKIIVDLHGHSHKSVGIGKVHKVKVFNPGAITLGSFGFLTLLKSEDTDYLWKVQKFEQHYL